MSEQKDKKWVNFVEDYFRESEKLHNNKVEEFNNFYELYNCIPETTENSDTEIFVPKSYEQVETIKPRLCSIFMLNPNRIIKIYPKNNNYFGDTTKTELLLFQQYKDLNIPRKLYDYYDQCAITGTTMGILTWRYEEDKKGNILYDEPFFYVVDMYDVYVDPNASDIDDMRYIIFRRDVTREYLERLQSQHYLNISEVPKHGGRKTNQEKKIRDEQSGKESDNFEEGDWFELKDCWIREYKDGVESIRNVVTIDGTYEVRNVTNKFYKYEKKVWKPYLPFIKSEYVKRPFLFYGTGVIFPIESLQKELNAKRRMRIDNAKFLIQKTFIATEGAIPDKMKDLKLKAGKINIFNRIDEQDGIRELKFSDLSPSLYRDEAILNQDIQNATGASDYVSGGTGASGETATETSIKTNQAMTRMNFSFKMMAESGIQKLFEHLIYLNQQFLDKPKQIKAFNDEEEMDVIIYPEDIQGEWDVKVEIDINNFDTATERRSLIELLQMLKGSPFINEGQLIEEVIKTYKLPNIGKIINKNPPPEMLQAYMMGQGGMGAQGGSPPRIRGAQSTAPGIPVEKQARTQGQVM